jgi:hypothetical protein
MLSKTQLSTMLDLQDGMNKKVNQQWLQAGYSYLRAAMIESVEAIEHHGWKWWKAQRLDLPQVQMELVDIWHFALSHIIIQHEGNIQAAANELAASLNFFRQDHGYKEGSYIKIWDGREDNEHLVEVLNTTDSDLENYADALYSGLQSRYPD